VNGERRGWQARGTASATDFESAKKDKIPAGGYASMTDYPEDVYTELSDFDVHTLNNLGPLTGLAGIWEGTRSLDVNPKAEGPEKQVFV